MVNVLVPRDSSKAPITAIDAVQRREANQRIVTVTVHRAEEFARIKALYATGARSRAWVRLQQLLGSIPDNPSP